MIHLYEALMSSKTRAKKELKYKYHPKTKDELKQALNEEYKLQGNKANLNCIDTSEITDMSGLFIYSAFQGDISGWNTSKVTTMRNMFYDAAFNGDISRWDVSRVTDMNKMFYKSEFKGDISDWNTVNVTNMYGMFASSPLDGKEPKWYKI